MVVAAGMRNLASDRPPGALEGVHPDDGGQQAGPHHPAATGSMALVQGLHHAVRAVHPGQQVADGQAHAGWFIG